MAKPGGNVTVMTEVGYCPFCGRTRNLRREERRLGGLVRATLECESCHRTLSSTMGPVLEPPAEAAAPAKPEPEPEPSARTTPAKRATGKAAAAAAKKPAARKPAAAAKKPAGPARKAATKKKA